MHSNFTPVQFHNGVLFVSNQYKPGTSLRLDRYKRQFFVMCYGSFTYPEDGLYQNTYQIEGSVELAVCPTIEHCLEVVDKIFKRWKTDGRHPDVVFSDQDVIDFKPRLVQIRTEKGGLVASADVERDWIPDWLYPPINSHEETRIKQKVQQLRQLATYERTCDNFHSARCIDRAADKLEGCLTDPRFCTKSTAVGTAACKPA